ncbi:MAG TPA: hypothetical protein PLM96_06125 [Methanoregulaceae archaeon]|jgi:DNA-binding transcriptional regulator YhcF (GntR family)|nr:hypothetical protein [Methanoregulaceae archaeon]MDD5048362.1 hypothetical protein [Methanoregulaceae archaeon]MDD5684226.1 hypothetical protein [Methanoregulaceae archaeon]HPJ73265.1 hypothetical protein [Methanoregulaceae archaeon]HPQ76201.1 hypothetical protein [Methanoregulaceae archaeon]
MPALNIDLIFDAAIRIHLLIDGAITLNISGEDIRIKFPTTRALADFLGVPHYYVLPYFAMMEENQLVTRAERIGIFTTTAGTKKYLDLLLETYHDEGIRVLGADIFREIQKRASG